MKEQLNHYMFDGYVVNSQYMVDVKRYKSMIKTINKRLKLNGSIKVVPYFKGKIPEDEGISGSIIFSGGHLTIHTFSYRKCVFIDFLDTELKVSIKDLKEIILNYFPTIDYDDSFNICKDICELTEDAFGPHFITIINKKSLKEEFKYVIDKIIGDINMTPITGLMEYIRGGSANLLQMIAESHISLKEIREECFYLEVFSCKSFDIDTLVKLLKESLKVDSIKYELYIRGKKFNRSQKNIEVQKSA